MVSRKLDEIAADIEDATTVVEELQVEPNADPQAEEKLDELRETLENAADAIDEITDAQHD